LFELNDVDRMQLSTFDGTAGPCSTEVQFEVGILINHTSHRTKRQHGVYYTPSQVADLLVRWAICSKEDLILEPSFGGCAFLDASISRLRQMGSQQPEQQLSGFDIDSQAFEHLATLGSGLANMENRFIHGDFLLSTVANLSGRKVDAIVGNPPFVPYRRMNTAQRKVIDEWSKAHASVVPKDSSLWAYFLQHALNFLRPGGRMAWVLPSSLLFVEYGQALRDLVQAHFQSTLYIDLQEQLFIGTGTRERVVLLFAEGFSDTPLPTSNAATLTFSHLAEVEQHFTQANPMVNTTIRLAQRSAPIEEAAELIAQALSRVPNISLGDVSKIVIGDVIGDIPFFVKSRAAWNTLGINEDELLPILTKSSQAKGIRITGANVNRMIEHGAKCLLLRPHISNRSDAAEEFLATYPTAKRATNATFSRRPIWFISTYDNSADLFFPSLSTLGPRVIVNSCNVACANSLYRIHLHSDWRLARFAIALYSVSSFAQLSAELVGGGMGEGALKLNPSHLKQLPLPSHLYDSNADTYDLFLTADRLIARGQISEARKTADEWLMPVFGKKVLAQIGNILELVRARRRDYRCELP
jgi:adenine-specific DNA-methyltransferase